MGCTRRTRSGAPVATKNNQCSYNGIRLPSPSRIRDLVSVFRCDEETKNDLASEAGVKMFMHRKRLEPKRVEGWLVEVMTNALHDLHRSSRVKHNVPIVNEDQDDEAGSKDHQVNDKMSSPCVSEHSLSSHEAEPDTKAQGIELGRILREELVKMKKSHRDMICLLSYGISMQQIADELDIPLGTVKSRINRSRNVLLCRLQARGF